MISPLLSGSDLLEDIRSSARDAGALHLWWLGQSGFLLAWRGIHVLLDPYLSDSLTSKYARTDRPHVRMTERVIAPEELDFIDVVTSSHAHTDHLDSQTLGPLLAANPKIKLVIPEANRKLVAERLAIDPRLPLGLDDGKMLVVAGLSIRAVASAHEEFDQDEAGRHRYLGYVIRSGAWTVYHSGDTIRYAGLAEKLRAESVDIAMLPINGREPGRRVAGNMNGREAVQLAQQIGARMVIPCHFDMFEFNTASPEEFIAEAGRLRQPYRVLQCGERFDWE